MKPIIEEFFEASQRVLEHFAHTFSINFFNCDQVSHNLCTVQLYNMHIKSSHQFRQHQLLSATMRAKTKARENVIYVIVPNLENTAISCWLDCFSFCYNLRLIRSLNKNGT